MKTEPALVPIKAVARRLGLRSAVVLGWARARSNGAPQPIKLSDQVYAFRVEEAEAWVESILSQTEPTTE